MSSRYEEALSQIGQERPSRPPGATEDPWAGSEVIQDAPGAVQTQFDASRYLTQIGGRDYLEVKWRLLWLRTLHPDASLETQLQSDDGARAVFFCRVSIPGGGMATGWGSESYQDFGDYLEKAETKSIGRALAALGFGTQFTYEHEFGADQGRVVDAPVSRPVPIQSQSRPPAQQGGSLATERQVKAIYAIGRAAHLSEGDIIAKSQMLYQAQPSGLTMRQASEFIDRLKQAGQPTR